MTSKKLTYEQLESRLAAAEEMIEALESGQTDAIVSGKSVLVLRLKETEDALRLAQEAGGVGLFDWNLITGKVTWTPELEHLFGMKHGDFGGTYQDWAGYVHSEDLKRLEPIFDEWLLSDRDELEWEYRFRRADTGEERWITAKARLFRDQTGKPVRVTGTNTDSTDGKKTICCLQAQKQSIASQLAEIETIYDTVPAGLAVLSTDLRFVRINSILADINGVSVEAHLGKHVKEVIPHLAEAAEKAMQRVLRTGKAVRNYEIAGSTRSRPEVKRIWNEHWTPFFNESGEIIGVHVMVEDVTEKRLYEKQLEMSQKQFQTLAEHSPDIIARFDLNLRHIYVNQTVSVYTRMPPEHFIGKTSLDSGMPADLCVQWDAAMKKAIETNSAGTLLFEFSKDGETRILEGRFIPERNAEGRVESLLCVTRDISDMHRTELALKRERDMFQLITQKTDTHLAYLDRDFIFLKVNKAFASGSGSTQEDLLGQNYFDLFPQAENQAIFEKVRDTGEAYAVKAKPYELPWDPERGTTWWDWSLTPVKDRTDKVTGFVYSLTEVTAFLEALQEREHFISQIQSLLRELTEQAAELKAIIKTIADPLLVLDRDGNIVQANPAAHKILGEENFKRSAESNFNLLTPAGGPEPCPAEKSILNLILSGKRIREKNCRLHLPGGSVRNVLVSGALFSDSKRDGAVLTWHDITDRLEREEKLRQSEERYMLAQQLAGFGHWDWDIRSGTVEWSQTVNRLFGLDPGFFDKSYRTFIRLIHPEDRQRVIRTINACIEEDIPYHVEHRIIRPDDSVRWLQQTGNVVRNENRLAVRMLGMVLDITGRKEADANQRLLGKIVSESQDAIVLRGMDNRITAWNAGAERIFGYTAEQMIGSTGDCIIPKARQKELHSLLERVRCGEQIRHLETERVRANGRGIFVSSSFSPIRDESGNVYAVSAIEHDITDRIKSEKALRDARDQLESRVHERTKALHQANQELKKEADQRKIHQEKLRSLAEELVRTEEHQRREIAAGLHDKIIQMLIFSNIKLEQLSGNGQSKSNGKIITDVQQIINETIQELRTMTFKISPPVLYELGLVSALEWLLEQFEKQHGIRCFFEDDRQDKPVSDCVRNMLFRCVNELLNNIFRHANAENVRIRVLRQGEHIIIEVEDDGRGFDPDKNAVDMQTGSGFGLFNIQERITWLQGGLNLISKIGEGTLVRLTAPLERS